MMAANKNKQTAGADEDPQAGMTDVSAMEWKNHLRAMVEELERLRAQLPQASAGEADGADQQLSFTVPETRAHDAAALLSAMQALPGVRAAQFSATACTLTVRFRDPAFAHLLKLLGEEVLRQ